MAVYYDQASGEKVKAAQHQGGDVVFTENGCAAPGDWVVQYADGRVLGVKPEHFVANYGEKAPPKKRS